MVQPGPVRSRPRATPRRGGAQGGVAHIPHADRARRIVRMLQRDALGGTGHGDVTTRVDGHRADDPAAHLGEHEVDESPLAERADVDRRRCAKAQDAVVPAQQVAPRGRGGLRAAVDEPVPGVVAAARERVADEGVDGAVGGGGCRGEQVEHGHGIRGRRVCRSAGGEPGDEGVGAEARPVAVEGVDQRGDRGAGGGIQGRGGVDAPHRADGGELPALPRPFNRGPRRWGPRPSRPDRRGRRRSARGVHHAAASALIA